MAAILCLCVAALAVFLCYCAKRLVPRNVYASLTRTNIVLRAGVGGGGAPATKQMCKRPFSAQSVPDRIDAIVIGSGIGSLVTAAVLARAGWRALVLEQHTKAGGCCHSFKERKHFEFDTGLHFVGRMSPVKGNLGHTLNALSSGAVVWTPQGDVYDVIEVQHEGSTRTFNIRIGRYANEQMLLSEFPNERAAINTFFDQMFDKKPRAGWILAKLLPERIVKFMHGYDVLDRYSRAYKEVSTVSAVEAVNALTQDALLRTVLIYLIPGIGFGLDCTYMMLLETWRHYITDGGYYPRGGSAAIVRGLVPTICQAAGAVLCRADVTDILVDDSGTAIGVRVSPAKSKGGDKETPAQARGCCEIRAPVVISGAGVTNTFKRMLPRSVAEKSRYFKHVDNTGGTLNMFFFGFDGDSETLRLHNKNKFYLSSSEDAKVLIESYLALPSESVPETKPPFYSIIFPSAKDPGYNEKYPGKSLCIIAAPSNYEWFRQWAAVDKKHRPDDYNEWKGRLVYTMLQVLEEHHPQLKGMVEHMDMATPLTMRHYLRAAGGSIASLAHNVQRMGPSGASELRTRTDIDKLYLTGQDVAIGGVAGALTAGLVAAEYVLQDHGAKNDCPVRFGIGTRHLFV